MLASLHHYWSILAGFAGVIGLLLRLVWQISAFIKEMREFRKQNAADHARYEQHLQTPHRRFG